MGLKRMRPMNPINYRDPVTMMKSWVMPEKGRPGPEPPRAHPSDTNTGTQSKEKFRGERAFKKALKKPYKVGKVKHGGTNTF